MLPLHTPGRNRVQLHRQWCWIRYKRKWRCGKSVQVCSYLALTEPKDRFVEFCIIFVVIFFLSSALVQFFTLYPAYKKVDFYLTGEVRTTYFSVCVSLVFIIRERNSIGKLRLLFSVLRWKVHTSIGTLHFASGEAAHYKPEGSCHRRWVFRSPNGKSQQNESVVVVVTKESGVSESHNLFYVKNLVALFHPSTYVMRMRSWKWLISVMIWRGVGNKGSVSLFWTLSHFMFLSCFALPWHCTFSKCVKFCDAFVCFADGGWICQVPLPDRYVGWKRDRILQNTHRRIAKTHRWEAVRESFSGNVFSSQRQLMRTRWNAQ